MHDRGSEVETSFNIYFFNSFRVHFLLVGLRIGIHFLLAGLRIWIHYLLVGLRIGIHFLLSGLRIGIHYLLDGFRIWVHFLLDGFRIGIHFLLDGFRIGINYLLDGFTVVFLQPMITKLSALFEVDAVKGVCPYGGKAKRPSTPRSIRNRSPFWKGPCPAP